jgi:hypothetical protein
MQFTTDHIFHIGGQHLRNGMPCQDYALSGVTPHLAYAVVADGCSSGGKTDIGARVLALATAQVLAQHSTANLPAATDISAYQLATLKASQGLLGLQKDDLLATAGVAVVSAAAGATLSLWGDGVLATLSHTGELRLVRVEWANNMPYYPSYRLANLSAFIAAHGGEKASAMTITVATGRLEGPMTLDPSFTVSVTEGANGYHEHLTPEALNSSHFIAVFTDGVMQVEGLEWYEVARQLLLFKSTEGAFAIRRMNRFLRDAQSHGKGPQDDIGYAVIQLSPTPKEA